MFLFLLFVFVFVFFLFLFFFLFFFVFVFVFVVVLVCFIYIVNEVHWEALSRKVLDDIIKIGGHIEVMPTMLARIKTSLEKAFFTIYGPS